VKPRNDLSDKGRAVEEWVDLHFFRPIGIRIARALYPTGISPDQVTLWSLLIGLVAGHLFVYRDRWIDVIGFVLFIVSDVFDSADGQLARLRGTSTRFGRALDGINDNLRFVNLYLHLMYRLAHGGVGWWGVLLVALAGLAHTYQSAAADFIRNAFLYLGVGKGGELDLPEDLETKSAGAVLERFGARVYRDYVVRQAQLFPRSVKLMRLLRAGGAGVPPAFRDRRPHLGVPVGRGGADEPPPRGVALDARMERHGAHRRPRARAYRLRPVLLTCSGTVVPSSGRAARRGSRISRRCGRWPACARASTSSPS